MKILGLIPARGGSKGIPGKNIKLLNGKPLIHYTIEPALEVKQISVLALSSDDNNIINCAKKFNIEVPFIRPLHLAADNTPSIDVIIHAIQYYHSKNILFDAVCLLQPTYPFRTSKLIDDAISKFIESGADSLISVLEVPHHLNPHWTFEKETDNFLKISTGEKKIIARRQELPTCFYRDGAIYITKVKTILEDNSLYGEKVSYINSLPESYVNIDTMEDWHDAEFKIKSNQ